MLELHPSQFHAAKALFEQTHYGVLAAGTLDGGHPGHVFLDDLAAPLCGLVCTRLDYYFLAGQPSRSVLDWLYEQFQSQFIPQMKAIIGTADVILFFEPSTWQGLLFERFADCQPLLIHKKRYTLPSEARIKIPGWQAQLPANVQIAPFTADLLKQLPDLASQVELFWGSLESFLEKGFGWALLYGEQPASTCMSVFVGNGEVEIDIHTADAYRGQGFAYLLSRAFIDDSLRRGLNPIWGCWPENLPSVRLAEKLGFVENALHPACFWEGRKEESQ